MMNCKFCGFNGIIKFGISKEEKQIFRCKSCKKCFREGDKHQKYGEKEREMAFVLYTEGNGFRRIARILSRVFDKKIYYQTVVKWLQKRHNQLKIEEKIEENGVEIIELDELYATFKKNLKMVENGSKCENDIMFVYGVSEPKALRIVDCFYRISEPSL